MNREEKRICKNCGGSFRAKSANQKYCKLKCHQAFILTEKRKLNKTINLPSGSVGALGELMVACDMMVMGYEIFRAVSPSCSTDLIAIRNGKTIRIEVRTGFYESNGTIRYPKNFIRADVVAVVTHVDQKIHYIPEI